MVQHADVRDDSDSDSPEEDDEMESRGDMPLPRTPAPSGAKRDAIDAALPPPHAPVTTTTWLVVGARIKARTQPTLPGIKARHGDTVVVKGDTVVSDAVHVVPLVDVEGRAVAVTFVRSAASSAWYYDRTLASDEVLLEKICSVEVAALQSARLEWSAQNWKIAALAEKRSELAALKARGAEMADVAEAEQAVHELERFVAHHALLSGSSHRESRDREGTSSVDERAELIAASKQLAALRRSNASARDVAAQEATVHRLQAVVGFIPKGAPSVAHARSGASISAHHRHGHRHKRKHAHKDRRSSPEDAPRARAEFARSAETPAQAHGGRVGGKRSRSAAQRFLCMAVGPMYWERIDAATRSTCTLALQRALDRGWVEGHRCAACYQHVVCWRATSKRRASYSPPSMSTRYAAHPTAAPTTPGTMR